MRAIRSALKSCRPSPLLYRGRSRVLLRPLMVVALPPVNQNYDALLLDAGGTLLQLATPIEDTYASIGRKYGITVTPCKIKQGFQRAFAPPWPKRLWYQGDGRDFWKAVVSEATGCPSIDYFEEVYQKRPFKSCILKYFLRNLQRLLLLDLLRRNHQRCFPSLHLQELLPLD
ncbi:uncharacterized protein LOC144713289 isoform X3 [Wolffia australiana]